MSPFGSLGETSTQPSISLSLPQNLEEIKQHGMVLRFWSSWCCWGLKDCLDTKEEWLLLQVVVGVDVWIEGQKNFCVAWEEVDERELSWWWGWFMNWVNVNRLICGWDIMLRKEWYCGCGGFTWRSLHL